jgi:hypothetical protein
LTGAGAGRPSRRVSESRPVRAAVCPSRCSLVCRVQVASWEVRLPRLRKGGGAGGRLRHPSLWAWPGSATAGESGGRGGPVTALRRPHTGCNGSPGRVARGPGRGAGGDTDAERRRWNAAAQRARLAAPSRVADAARAGRMLAVWGRPDFVARSSCIDGLCCSRKR